MDYPVGTILRDVATSKTFAVTENGLSQIRVTTRPIAENSNEYIFAVQHAVIKVESSKEGSPRIDGRDVKFAEIGKVIAKNRAELHS